MEFILEIHSESGLIVSINDKMKTYYTDGTYFFKDLPKESFIQIKQIEPKRKWFLAPLYILEGFFTLALYCHSGYSSVEFLHPYVNECNFKLISDSGFSNVYVNAVESKVNADGKCEKGTLEISGAGISDVMHYLRINHSSFKSSFVKMCFTFFSPFCVLIPIFLCLLFITPNVIGSVIILLVTILLLIFSIYKIKNEHRKLSSIKSHISKDI